MKKISKALCVLLVYCVVMTGVQGLFELPAFAASATGVVVEAESGVLSNDMTAYASDSASGGACIAVVGGSRLDEPTTLPAPDATYTFNVTTAGNYKIYLRAFSTSDGSDSFYYRWDGGKVTENYKYTNKTTKVGTTWEWNEISAENLSVGTHKLEICHREPSCFIDLMVVATNLTKEEMNAIDAKIAADNQGNSGSGSAITLNTLSGSALLEAENATINASWFADASDASASNGNVVSAVADQSTAPASSVSGLSFNIKSDRSAYYTIWARYSAAAGQNSLYYSMDGGSYTTQTWPVTGSDPSAYAWTKIYTTPEQLFSGKSYYFQLCPAKAGLRIDQIVVTSYPFFSPVGAVTDLSNLAFSYALPSGTYPAPSITPPPAHPRLNFTSADIGAIKANMQKSQNANALAAYNGYLTQNTDGLLSTVVVAGGTNYSGSVLAVIEAYAFKYALDGDVAYGNKAITAIKNYLKTVALDDDIQDVTRPMGHIIYVSSEVYDWCYPLLTAEDKNTIITACETIGKRMEVGYPPSGQGAVTGHGGELQLFRDLLGFGIATYEDRPDIYNFIAGRLLSQFIEPRNYWYESNTHHQGDSYGNFRYYCEMVFQGIMKKMSGQTMFSAQGEFVPYQWIYTRRPDGQFFRNGDNYQEKGAKVGTYWTNDRYANFYSANFYGNSFVKQQYIAEDQSFNTFPLSNGIMTPVSFLLYNNPDLGGVSHTSTFPLTQYFGSPYGMMVARTGWTQPGSVELGSNVAMAQMIIGEQWAANHQHLDAGSFQLYYKGALASESGIYDDYGSSHDTNYNKETIAHNALLILDPGENTGTRANIGGQRRGGGEVNTFSAWMNAGYDRGTVLDHAYDPNHVVPQYSYIKGDITRAYTGKVSQVLRSMLFMPLEDASHPAALIVMDKVISSNPAFKKTWLLHSQQEPALSSNTAVIKRDTIGYNGRMDLTTLLPANVSYTKVGGVGNEFNINGVNYPPLSYGDTSCEYGAWRIEASPPTANATDYFLNVMQVSDADQNAAPLNAELIETNMLAGAKIANRVAVFGKAKERMAGPMEFTVPGSETGGLEVMVTGVKEGIWKVYKGLAFVGSSSVTADAGVLEFEGGAGDYTLLHMDSDTASGLLSLSYGNSGNILGSGELNYAISMPNGTMAAPVVSATPIDPAASVVIQQANGVPGTAVVVVTSADVLATKTYTIHFTRPEVSDVSLASLSYTYNGARYPVNLQQTVNRYKAVLPYSTVLPVITATPSYGGATVSVTAPGSLPGTAVITVTAADGSQSKKYYLRLAITSGTITNLTNNISAKTYMAYSDMQPQSLSELRELYNDVGADWQNYCRFFVDRSVTGTSAVIGSGSIPKDTSITRIPNGENWFVMWIARDTAGGDTSNIFHGASWIAVANDDFKSPNTAAYVKEVHPDAVTFDISRGATVWVALKTSTEFVNFTNNGWTRVNANEGYKVVHGDGGTFSCFYKKHFTTGRVEIPSLGQSTGLPDRGFMPIVIWDPQSNYGDVSGDGVIDISDVIMTAEIAVGYEGYTAEQIQRANVSSKTQPDVDISDVVLIAERAVGEAAPFPVELP